MPLTSKLTAKYQATIPQEVRKQLNLQSGDRLLFVIEDECVVIQKASSIDWDYLNAGQILWKNGLRKLTRKPMATF